LTNYTLTKQIEMQPTATWVIWVMRGNEQVLSVECFIFSY